MNWLASQILSLILRSSSNGIKKIHRRLKLRTLKKSLNDRLKNTILNRYQNEPFYNVLDSFLSRNNIFDQLFSNQNGTGIHEYTSLTGFINYYSNLFIEEYSIYKDSLSEVKLVIKLYYKVVYDALNCYDKDDTAKIVVNNLKELFGELSTVVEQVGEYAKETNIKVSNLERKFDEFINSFDYSGKTFDVSYIDKEALIQYFAAIQALYLSNKENKHYFERKIYKTTIKDDGNAQKEERIDAITALLENKRILLLGEAGCGKTLEAHKLLYDLSTDFRTEKLIPIYLPLIEYGRLFNSLREGICKGLEMCFGKNTVDMVADLLRNSRLAIVLDGIDDIQDTEQRNKCILELRDMFIYYGENYFFVTSRANRYNNEFDKIKVFNLTELAEMEVRQALQEENVYNNIPDSYYKLFANPLLLKIGIQVLKNNSNKDLLNRSILFDELMLHYCEKWDSIKGNVSKLNLTHSELFMILGRIAYEKFDFSCFSCLDFDQFISKLFHGKENSKIVVNELLGLGIFQINNGISFAHKTYKEYFAAYFLINVFPFSQNIEKYFLLSGKDEWKEVFIFAAGMFKSLEEQDNFFEMLLEKNLKLYVECVHAKSDLSNAMSAMTHEGYVRRYLEIFLQTYIKMIEKYFNPIKSCFDPSPGLNEDGENKKICLVGAVSNDRESISYLFDRVDQSLPDINILSDREMIDYGKDLERRAVMERRNVKRTWVNMKLSNLMGDSSRKVALEKVKKELKDILEKKILLESDYLLCERVASSLKRFPELRDKEDLTYIYNYIKSDLEKSLSRIGEHEGEIVSIVHNNVEMLPLEAILRHLVHKSIVLKEYLLPGMDVECYSGIRWTWDFYSQKQREERIIKFFYWHQLSYIYMVEKNFPNMCNLFNRYQDSPYQTIVYLVPEETNTEGYHSEPIIQYYYIASIDGKVDPPIIKISDKNSLNAYEVYEKEIENSYYKIGKKVKEASITTTRFTFTTTSRRTGGDTPLSEYVYDSIKKSLEDVLGVL